MEIKKAVRTQRKCKIALNGISGSGKTYSALAIASGLGKKICLIDTENQSSSLYADDFEFDVLNLDSYTPDSYIAAMDAVKKAGYDVVIIDSLSHAWQELLEEVDRIQKRERGKNCFTAWADVTPIYNRLVAHIVRLDMHCIANFRAKSDYVMEEYTDKQGKTRTKPVKVGLAPIFRQGGEYEFDLVVNLDLDHNLIIEKTRYKFLDGAVIKNPDKKLGKKIGDWLNSGAVPPAEPEAPSKPTAPAQTEQGTEYWYKFDALDDAKRELAEQMAVKQHAIKVDHPLGIFYTTAKHLEPRKNFDKFLSDDDLNCYGV